MITTPFSNLRLFINSYNYIPSFEELIYKTFRHPPIQWGHNSTQKPESGVSK